MDEEVPRRRCLSLLGAIGVTALAGCVDQSDSNTTATSTATETATSTDIDTSTATATPDESTAPTDTPTEQPTETPRDPGTTTEEPTETTEEDTPTETEEPTETPESETIYPEDTPGTAEGIYHDTIENIADDYDLDFDIDTSQSFPDQVKEAAIKGGKAGGYVSGGIGDTTHWTAAAAVAENLNEYNFTDDDIAAPHYIFVANEEPAVILEYTNPETGEKHSDLLEAAGDRTDENAYNKNWRNGVFWDNDASRHHVLDGDLWDRGLEETSPEKLDEDGERGLRESYSSLPYNSHENGVAGIIPYSLDALHKAEEKINGGNAKDVFDDLTELANDPSIDNFAFGYDEDKDTFTAEDTIDHSDFRDTNPFHYIEV